MIHDEDLKSSVDYSEGQKKSACAGSEGTESHGW